MGWICKSRDGNFCFDQVNQLNSARRLRSFVQDYETKELSNQELCLRYPGSEHEQHYAQWRDAELFYYTYHCGVGQD